MRNINYFLECLHSYGKCCENIGEEKCILDFAPSYMEEEIKKEMKTSREIRDLAEKRVLQELQLILKSL